MTAKSVLMPALATVLSFIVVVAVTTAADCTHIGVTCPGWGANSPQAQQTGYCCVTQTTGAVPCGTGIKSVRQGTSSGCGELRAVVGGNCTGNSGGGCGVFEGRTGCTTVPCPG